MKEASSLEKEMLSRADDAISHNSEQYRKAKEDRLFCDVPGHQWDGHMQKKRKNRPCYEFNRTRQLVRRVTGQMLQNKPAPKAIPVEDADQEGAEIRSGLIRHIMSAGEADTAISTCAQWAVASGYGVVRVHPEYAGDDSFDQDLCILEVDDPTRVRWDPMSRKKDRTDARYCFIFGETIPKSEFSRRYPGKNLSDFTTGASNLWVNEDGVVIAEYWYKEPTKKTLFQLSDGRVIDEETYAKVGDELAMSGVEVRETRERDCHKIMTCLVYGGGLLEEPQEWKGKYFPIIPQWGDVVVIDGKEYFSGMVRPAMDGQRLHNFWQSTMIEVVAKLPNSPLMATPEMVKGLESYYERMGWDDPPVMLYNADPRAPGARPSREPIGQFPAGLANMSQIASEEMKAVTGIYDASLGAQSNETSGRAIMARNQQGDTANFVYTDNQSKMIRHLGLVLLDLLPHYYDGERTVRILGEDMAEKVIKLNEVLIDEQTGEQITINDMSSGKYDIVMTAGKAYETQRLEVADAAQALVGTPGPMGMLAQYLLISNLDVPGMDEFKKAARKALVGMGLLEPGEGDQPPAPPPPNPKDIASAEKDKAMAGKYQAETEAIQIQNMGAATEMGMAFGEMGVNPMAAQAPAPGGNPEFPNQGMM